MEKTNLTIGEPITRILNAPREKIRKIWTNPEYIKQWWGPKDFTAPYISIDLSEGGKFLYAMRGAGFDGKVKDWWKAGTHLEIVSMEKIVAKMSFSDDKGNPVPASYYEMPGNWPMETMLTVTFEDAEEDKTKVTVREDGIPSEMAEPSWQGWQQQLNKIDEILRSGDLGSGVIFQLSAIASKAYLVFGIHA